MKQSQGLFWTAVASISKGVGVERRRLPEIEGCKAPQATMKPYLLILQMHVELQDNPARIGGGSQILPDKKLVTCGAGVNVGICAYRTHRYGTMNQAGRRGAEGSCDSAEGAANGCTLALEQLRVRCWCSSNKLLVCSF